jgi:cellobiose phosphorylase
LPFYDLSKGAHGAMGGAAGGTGPGSAPVLEHLKRSVAFTRADVGQHGLPHLGFADWNDTVNLRKGAESLFNAHLYGKALVELIDLLEFRGDKASAETYRAWYSEMKDRVNKHAWDGAWWVRWFDSDGAPIGSEKNEKGKIWTNGQSWPVLSGFAPEERARAALDSVHRLLNTSAGIKLSAPGYDGFDPKKGGVTTYPPGAKENSGIFLHANPWVIIAECLMGNGERAWRYYNQINPAARNESMETFECEPYVYPQNILGDEHPQFGLARNSWLSGTASWSYQAATQYIAGVRPSHAGLVIDPCIPKAWSGFSVTRRWRGASYAITVKNPSGVNKGVKSLNVDGKALPAGAPVPAFGDGKTHTVEAVLG